MCSPGVTGKVGSSNYMVDESGVSFNIMVMCLTGREGFTLFLS